jgi:hypothetical protein
MKLHEESGLSIVMQIVSMFGDPHVLYLKHQVSGAFACWYGRFGEFLLILFRQKSLIFL